MSYDFIKARVIGVTQPVVDQKYLKECLDYNSETGLFYWKERPEEHFKTVRGWKTFNAQKAGKRITTETDTGYLQVAINKKIYHLHRLAFIYMGYDLKGFHVDHINHERKDNRWINLRLVTQQENNKNLTKRRSNISGITGVYYNEEESLWYPRIQVDYKNLSLGATKDFFEACCRRKSAEIKYEFHNNHGQG